MKRTTRLGSLIVLVVLGVTTVTVELIRTGVSGESLLLGGSGLAFVGVAVVLTIRVPENRVCHGRCSRRHRVSC